MAKENQVEEIEIQGTGNKQFVEFLLSDGRKAVVKKGTGKDVLRSQTEASEGGDPSKFMSAFMANVTTIDEKSLSSYDIEDLPANDFLKVQTQFSRLNFT